MRRAPRIRALLSWGLSLSAATVLGACQRDAGPATREARAEGPPRAASTAEATRTGSSMILATTTSTQDSGLLDSLVPMFERETGIHVKVIAVGTGAALRMAANGDADAVLVHAPASERRYVASGDLTGGRRVMHNDFILVGPSSDPAGVRRAPDLRAAMAAIARTGPFVSRGDSSGTHQLELALWRAAGINPERVIRREETGQGMGATLNIADQHRAYTLTDRGTYLALKDKLDLAILVEGDSALLNVYHVYIVNPQKHPRVNERAARPLAEFLTAPSTQRIIGDFGIARYGEPLFIPDADQGATPLSRRR